MLIRRILLTIFPIILCSIAKAIPAYPGLQSRLQPDGTTLSVRLHGDEYLSFTTTADGYTITKRSDGYYCYAQLNANGQLEPTNVVARDVAFRSEAERRWLLGVNKYLTPAMSVATVERRQAEQSRRARARAAAQNHAPLFDYNNFHGLIILAQFNDREFSTEDYPQIVQGFVNQEDYHGYSDTDEGRYIGSVRDYFFENSMGAFAPQFDIVGPYTLDVNEEYPQQFKNSAHLMNKVADAADNDVDFSVYDLNHDGVVDMVYIIFAGYGSNYEGEESKRLWPHASMFFDPDKGSYIYKDSVRLGSYACSTELFGTPTYGGFLDGIGTICHEFSHVLGLPDLYDTDYEMSDGQSTDPFDWTIMSGGGYQNNGRTPCGYTLYERYSLGFAKPETITGVGHYELEAIGESNFGYRLDTRVENEFFLVENRQKTSKWDQYLPGHGMLVFRVDSTDVSPWKSNKVNCNPNHNFFVLLRAGGNKPNEYGAYPSDPFPGKMCVTTLNNITTPANLLTWSGQPSRFGFENITESDGVISFDIVNVDEQLNIVQPYILDNGQSVTDAVMRAFVYTIDGCLVCCTTIGSLADLPLHHGLYIVRSAVGTWRLKR